jgi:vancomycin permeability regulator SanA
MKPAKRILLILVTWLLLHIVCTAIDGLIDRKENADLALILGSKVNEDGTLSTRLEKRLDCGLGLYQDHRVPKLIVSGGNGKEGFREGDKMREYLLKKGVPDSCIIVDNEGNNTTQSVQNTLFLQPSLHYSKVIVVSQYYHLTRAKMLFRKLGLRDVDSASPYYFEWRDIYSLLREFAAFYVQLF